MEDTLLFEAVGTSRKIQLFPHYVRIISNTDYDFPQANKTIFLRFISALKLHLPGTILPGYFNIEFIGGIENIVYDNKARAASDNTITFGKGQESDFIKLKEMLEERILVMHSSS